MYCFEPLHSRASPKFTARGFVIYEQAIKFRSSIFTFTREL
nr:hypothetical protein [uncultured Campylobacter sp.]